MIYYVIKLKPILIEYTKQLGISKEPYDREVAGKDYFILEE
jgi:hypothetical protein